MLPINRAINVVFCLFLSTTSQFYYFCSLRMFALSERATSSKKIPLNGHESARKPHRKEGTPNLSELRLFLHFYSFETFYIRRLQKQSFFPHTNPYIDLYFARYATVPMVIFRAWASRALACSSEEWITVSAKTSSSKAFYSENRR